MSEIVINNSKKNVNLVNNISEITKQKIIKNFSSNIAEDYTIDNIYNLKNGFIVSCVFNTQHIYYYSSNGIDWSIIKNDSNQTLTAPLSYVIEGYINNIWTTVLIYNEKTIYFNTNESNIYGNSIEEAQATITSAFIDKNVLVYTTSGDINIIDDPNNVESFTIIDKTELVPDNLEGYSFSAIMPQMVDSNTIVYCVDKEFSYNILKYNIVEQNIIIIDNNEMISGFDMINNILLVNIVSGGGFIIYIFKDDEIIKRIFRNIGDIAYSEVEFYYINDIYYFKTHEYNMKTRIYNYSCYYLDKSIDNIIPVSINEDINSHNHRTVIRYVNDKYILSYSNSNHSIEETYYSYDGINFIKLNNEYYTDMFALNEMYICRTLSNVFKYSYDLTTWSDLSVNITDNIVSYNNIGIIYTNSDKKQIETVKIFDNTLSEFQKMLLNTLYPIGSIIQVDEEKSPFLIFGFGEWVISSKISTNSDPIIVYKRIQ